MNEFKVGDIIGQSTMDGLFLLEIVNNFYENLFNNFSEVAKKLDKQIKEITKIIEPYVLPLQKICLNCQKYDSCHACCQKDINCYKYTSPKTEACEDFTYLDKFIPNIIANRIMKEIKNENQKQR